MPESHGVDHCLTVLKHQEAAIQEGIIFFSNFTLSPKNYLIILAWVGLNIICQKLCFLELAYKFVSASEMKSQ